MKPAQVGRLAKFSRNFGLVTDIEEYIVYINDILEYNTFVCVPYEHENKSFKNCRSA